MLVSLMRHYQNSFQDNVKQDAMNLFLGVFRPSAAPRNFYSHILRQSKYFRCILTSDLTYISAEDTYMFGNI